MLLRGLLLYIICVILPFAGKAQDSTLVQNVHGQVVDAESKRPLTGVTVVLQSNKQINDITDDNGYYTLKNVPIGRQAFSYLFPEYETKTLSEILVTSGKATELNIMLTENLHELEEVSVKANKFKSQALNEFATASSRSFSVEETRRYAASISDPARMAMNFAGVSNNGDLENDIVVRGNSPRGILWRLEGIEIPNPNHFSEMGSSGGAVSMINANTLGTSDFYTGAFPAEIGNALSGAFDLNLRNGNTETREYIAQIGLLGTELAAEGPFKKGSRSSYLIDYRYSTLALIQDQLSLNGLIPDYQDINLKLNFVTKKAGTVSVFGIGGINKILTAPESDSNKWNDENPNLKLDNRSRTGIAGISHMYFLKRKAYIKTVVSASYQGATNYADTLNANNNYQSNPLSSALYANSGLRLSILYNRKANEHTTMRMGVIAQRLGYSLERNEFHQGYIDTFINKGNTEYYQAYAQWKDRVSNKVTLSAGLHGTYFKLNNAFSMEPRASITVNLKRHKLTFASGLHSKPDLPTYLFTETPGRLPNKELDLLRAFHTVLGYDVLLPGQVHAKLELYYQYLYNVPIEPDNNSGFSLLNNENTTGLFGTAKLASMGTGANYGADLVIERPFANNYYVLFTGSLYKSTYTAYNGKTFPTHFDRRYLTNIVGGKEFYLNKKKHSLVGVNGKFIFSGGQRESPIDLQSSINAGKAVYVKDEYYSLQDPCYFRSDASVYYKLNNKRATHTVSVDVQNVTNRRNFSYTYFDTRSNSIRNVLETGIIPVISYRIEFH